MANVSVGKPAVGGAVSVGATTATLPTDATTALTGFTKLGYISDAGLVNSSNIEVNSIKAWGGDTVLSALTGKEDNFSCTFIESMNVDVLKEIYGAANVSGTLSTGISVSVKATDLAARAWVVDMVLTDGTLKRIVIPNGKITEIGDITYTDGEAIGYEVTISATPNSSGISHYEYIKTPTP